MNILIVTNGLTKSGGMRVISKLANKLIEAGDDVALLCPEDMSTPYFPTDAKIIKASNIFRTNRLLGEIANFFVLTYVIFRVTHKYQAILATHNSTAIQVWLATRFRSKGFYYIQAYEPEFYGNSIVHRLRKLIAITTYKLNLIQIVNSSTYKSYHEIKTENVVEPGIDLTVFNSFQRETKPYRTINIGCIGRREPWKGTNLIIEAFLSIRQTIKTRFDIDLCLNIAFEAPENISECGDQCIKVFQPHGDDNLASFYRLNEIFIATGLLQNGAFHYPCMESLACGCFVISNYAPATEDNAYLVHTVNVDSIRIKMLEVVEDIVDGQAKRLHESALDEFAWDKVAGKLRTILTQNLTGN